MNGVSKLLPWREKKVKASSSTGKSDVSQDIYRIFHCEDRKKSDRDTDKKIKLLQQRLEVHKFSHIKDSTIEYALRSPSSNGDPDKAYELLLLFEDAKSGTVKECNPNKKLLGAENREFTTCYIDSLLFAMFARLDSFESILSVEFPDHSKNTLAIVLRLWVNMMRGGKLITTDITKHLQDALGDCGWEEARKVKQQDVSEAFTFITDQLALPLLTLKMDVYHTGKDDQADHRIVRERILEVAIPKPPADGSGIKLEECLESYFNNRVEIKRHLARRNTLQGSRPSYLEKHSMQTETVNLGSRIDSKDDMSSIFSRRLDNSNLKRQENGTVDDIKVHPGRPLVGTFRKEVLMPAWQFFNLIPWSTSRQVTHAADDPVLDHPVTDEQVAAHFSTKRPILGICLKRYFMSPEGEASRLNTYIDIPLEIALPHFISDGSQDDGFGSSFTNFKLVLQSVICHRGTSVFAGHYVSLVRPGPEEVVTAGSKASLNDSDRKFQWFLFDDLASERVTYVDVRKALKDECPYLVFYQVQPINGSAWPSLNQGAPPTYDEATKSTPMLDPISDPPSASDQSDAAHSRKASATSSVMDLAGIPGATLQPSQTAPPSTTAVDSSNPRPVSIDMATLGTSNDVTVGRKSMDSSNKRSSVTFTESISGPSAPITPGEELSLKEGYMSSKDGTPGKDERGRGHHKDRDADKEKRHGSRWLSVRRRSRPASQPPIENRRPAGVGVGVGDIAKALRGAMSRDKLPVGPDSHAEVGSAVDDVADGVNAEGETNGEVATATNGTAATNGSVNVNVTAKGKDKLAFTRRKSTKKGKGRAHSVGKDEDAARTNGDGLPGGLPERQCIVI